LIIKLIYLFSTEEEQEVAAAVVASLVRAEGEEEEEDLLDVKAEEFREFAKYVEDNLRTQVDRERTKSGQEAVDFLAELADTPDVVADKVRQLAALVRGANHFVIYTGAGISTSAGLPGTAHM
jgi:precorrin-2 methylase